MKHSCIKPGCTNAYEDNDPDPYYCPSCNEEKKRIAAQIDAHREPPKPVMTPLQLYDSLPKGRGGFVDAKYFL